MDEELLKLLLGAGIIAAAIGLILLLIVRDTVRRKGIWGINFETPFCPDCGAKMPSARKPTSIRQAAFGGWTCLDCRCEMDKWGKPLASVKK